MRKAFEDILDGQEEYLWHLRECQKRCLKEWLDYTVRIHKEINLIRKTKMEALAGSHKDK